MTTYMFVLLFLGMMGFLGYYVVNNQHDLLNNNYNTRQELLTEQNYRGTIYSKDGEVLAQTVVDSQGTETRVYPYENMFSHIIGYSTKGRSGVESIANYYLINSNTSLANSGNSSRKRTPRDAIEISPGRMFPPPPQIATVLAV